MMPISSREDADGAARRERLRVAMKAGDGGRSRWGNQWRGRSLDLEEQRFSSCLSFRNFQLPSSPRVLAGFWGTGQWEQSPRPRVSYIHARLPWDRDSRALFLALTASWQARDRLRAFGEPELA